MLSAAVTAEGLTAEGPAVDFSQDNGWVVFGKALFIFVFLVVLTLLTIWGERRVVARMQSRPGPNRTGPFGLIQGLADGVKLALKEDIIPKAVDRLVFILAPIISAVTCFISFSVIPFGPEARIPFTDIVTPLQLTDLPIAVLFMLAVAAVGVYGILLAGWSSGSTYPLLGGLRSSAQVISYEIAMGLALISVFLYSGSMSTSAIVEAQANGAERFGLTMPSWFIVQLPVAFVIYVIAMVGETNRAPFDLPEAEGELVGGFHTEYSSLKFALFFLAEYVNMITVSAIATTLFLGGWRAPWPLSAIGGGMLNEGWWPMLWFIAKLLGFIFFFIWLRGTLPRLRYDQFMRFGWKVLIPVALVWIVAVSFWRAANSASVGATGVQRLVLLGIGAALLVVIFGALLTAVDRAERRDAARHVTPEDEVDPFAGGFPVPALPGQRLIRSNGRDDDELRPALAAAGEADEEVHGG
ncbi:MAG: NADH-quinone oxidoreductase subunit NuoH [Kineosporiaceae bacterium]|nr:NADH-quinone oxidoreductase subunit NuoH [Kineosporiaceae bacterium]MBK7624038.1 NADH-quinone oxidoreductase subunit NuoH [Kineosporiaceae bacterium]MBK8075793.1 NADH-quinone oxidoreductase subunit NuoH [Kineosporiaceae bacterium]